MLIVLQAAWVGLALLAGPALAGTLDGASTPVVVVAAVLAAAGWGAGLVAALVPRTLGLTVLRTLAPTALAAAVACTVRASSVGAAEVAALAGGALVTGLALLVPAVADRFVDGSSYGAERRYGLRAPVGLLLGPVPLAWVVVAVPAVAGPLSLAARAWVPGVLLVVLGAVAGRPAAASLHQMARRWLVFVPAGVVVHDPLVLADPVLVPRRLVVALRPAVAGDVDGAVDAGRGTTGLALALDTAEVVPVAVRTGRTGSDVVETSRLVFSPMRPGAVLAEARSRGYASAVPPPRTTSPS